MDPLTGDGVSLRDLRSEDFDDFFAIVGDDRVTSWLAFDSRTEEAARKMLDDIIDRSAQENRPDYMLAVTRLDDDRVIGFGRIAPSGTRAGKLGYAIGADHWGRGFATDAARTLVEFGFGTLDLHRISAAIGPENLASVAVVKHLGFSYEGRLRHHVFTNGAWRDSLLYSLLETEFRPG